MIYLDNAATTLHKPPQVEQAILEALHTAGNSGRGAHEPTLHAARIVLDTRLALAELSMRQTLPALLLPPMRPWH